MTPEELSQAIAETRDNALRELASLTSPEALERWRTTYLGRSSGITSLLRRVSSLPVEGRPEVGRLGNQARSLLEERLSQREEEVKSGVLSALGEAGRIDVTLPGRPLVMGRLHPITRTLREICQSFVTMGFQVVEGPEVEWDRYNFELLNIPTSGTSTRLRGWRWTRG
jgi:phenylalanyl-tRNA synthetase alpha chain